MPFGVWLMLGSLAAVGLVVARRGSDAAEEHGCSIDVHDRDAEARLRRAIFLLLLGFLAVFAGSLVIAFGFEGY